MESPWNHVMMVYLSFLENQKIINFNKKSVTENFLLRMYYIIIYLQLFKKHSWYQRLITAPRLYIFYSIFVVIDAKFYLPQRISCVSISKYPGSGKGHEYVCGRDNLSGFSGIDSWPNYIVLYVTLGRNEFQYFAMLDKGKWICNCWYWHYWNEFLMKEMHKVDT